MTLSGTLSDVSAIPKAVIRSWIIRRTASFGTAESCSTSLGALLDWQRPERKLGAFKEVTPSIARRSVGSHENPTDSDCDVESRLPGQNGWCRICPARRTNRTNSLSPSSPVGRKQLGLITRLGWSVEIVRVWLVMPLSVARLHSAVWPPEVRNPRSASRVRLRLFRHFSGRHVE